MRPGLLTQPMFHRLVAASGQDLISVFIPTHKKGRDVEQDRIHLKNQLSEVDENLAGMGWKPRERSSRLHTARDLLDDVEFWEHQEAGLAVYIDSDGAWEALSIAKPVEPDSFVMPVFQMRPLVAELHDVKTPVLALTRDSVTLFEVTTGGVTDLEAELASYDDVNWFVDRETQRQQHPDRAGTIRGRHGHDPKSRTEEDLARFLREVDSALAGSAQESPLVVLGDGDLVARFAQHSDRETLTPDNGGINTPISSTEVYEKVAKLVDSIADDRVEQAIELASDRLGVGLGTVDIDEALPSAMTGRVESVVVERGAAPVWGRLDEASMEVDRHRDRQPGDVDLLDRLVVWTVENGGEIACSESSLDGGPFIAVYRY